MAEACHKRFKSEEVLARTWENSFNESVAEGKEIRVQACEHVEEMQALHNHKLDEAISKVTKSISLAEDAKGSVKLAESAARRAIDSRAKAEELHRQALVECKTACLARITEETLKAQL